MSNDIKILASRTKKGFTLVELLVVIAIIGMLATLVLLQLGTARARARDARRIADVNQLRSAVEQYYNDNTAYPVGITSALIGPTAPISYLSIIPVDPSTGAPYNYAFNPASPTQFRISAELEGANPAFGGDADIDTTGWSTPGVPAVGNLQACTSAANDCTYDQGVK